MRQRKRQHGHDMSRVIDRRAAAVDLLIERAAGRDIMRHIRDVHAEQVMAVVQPVERDRVVKVLGVVAVDGEDQLVAQVEAAVQRGGIDLLRDRVRLLQHLVRLLQSVRHGSPAVYDLQQLVVGDHDQGIYALL